MDDGHHERKAAPEFPPAKAGWTIPRCFFNCLSFLLAFAVTGFLAGLWIPPLEVPVVSEKLRHLDRRGDEYNVLFLGTSRVHHQMVPEVFDEIMVEAGVRTRSFNLGIDGLHSPEDSFVLEKALNSRHLPLRWVIAEGRDINLRIEDINTESARALYWHDWPRMIILAKRAFWGGYLGRATFKQRLRGCRDDLHVFLCHCALWVQNFARAGRGETLLRDSLFGVLTENNDRVLGPLHDGFISIGNPRLDPGDAMDYARDFSELKTHPASVDYKDRASQMLLRSMVRLSKKHGAEFLFIVPPTLSHEKFLPDPRFGPVPLVLDFDDPERFPELFLADNRRDGTHLNQRGATAWTRLVARRLIALQPGGK